jgi:hypothetical protein
LEPHAPRLPRPIDVPEGATVIEHVAVVPMDRPGLLPDHTVVVSGDRIVAVAPADRVAPSASTRRVDGRGKFLVPGLADMHAHAIAPEDLELYAAAGVTQLRVLAASPVAVALRDEKVGGEALRPMLYVEGLLTDGDPPSWPFARVVSDVADVAREVALHKEMRLPSIKVYTRLTRDVYDAFAAQGRAAGLGLVGHVPDAVGLEHALASGQRSIEHLWGYERWLASSTAAGARPSSAVPSGVLGRIAAFEHADEARMPEIARRTREAGTWNCATLVLNERMAMRDDVEALRAVTGLRYVPPETVAAWQLSRGRGSPERSAALRRSIPKRRALLRALHEQGAGLLVGTDSGNPWIVPGFSVVDEIALFVEAGLPPWEALRAATSAAAHYLGQGEESGTVVVGRRADLLLVDANPLERAENLRRREGVMLRGAWHPASELDARLEERVARYGTGRSHFEGVAPPAVDGRREISARFENWNGDVRAGEQRLVIDERADGTRRAIAELAEGGTSGVLRVEVELGGSGRGYRQEYVGGALMALVGVLETRHDGAGLRVTVRTPLGDALERELAAPAGAFLGGETLAPDVLLHDRLGQLGIGERAEVEVVSVRPGLAPRLDSWRIRARREPDSARKLGEREAQVRAYAIDLVLGSQTVPGTLTLDSEGHLLEQTLGSQRTVRIE